MRNRNEKDRSNYISCNKIVVPSEAIHKEDFFMKNFFAFPTKNSWNEDIFQLKPAGILIRLIEEWSKRLEKVQIEVIHKQILSLALLLDHTNSQLKR